jgi:hypothetical protein
MCPSPPEEDALYLPLELPSVLSRGGVTESGVSNPVSFFSFLRLMKKNTNTAASAAKNATPPTVAPTIIPTESSDSELSVTINPASVSLEFGIIPIPVVATLGEVAVAVPSLELDELVLVAAIAELELVSVDS